MQVLLPKLRLILVERFGATEKRAVTEPVREALLV